MKPSFNITSKIVSCVFTLLFVLSCIYSVSADGFHITDLATNTEYEVTYLNDEVIIKSPEGTATLPFFTKLMDCSVYNGVVTLYSYNTLSENTYNYQVYYYNTFDGSYTAFATPYKASAEEYYCIVDKNKNVYMRDLTDRTVIYQYTFYRDTYTYEVGATVLQLLSIDYTDILIVTTDGIYCISGNKLDKISDCILSAPCSYTQDTIIDSDGNEYKMINRCLIPVTADTETVDSTCASSYSEEVKVVGECFVLDAGTTYARLYKKLGIDKSQLNVYKSSGELLTSGRLGTGMRAIVDNREYLIIVSGDLTGEGNVNSRDLKLLMKILSGEETLDENMLLCADLNNDELINTKDLLKLSQMY